MTSEQFVYWLQGFSEVSNSETITKQQWKIIQDHLKLVLNKVTPSYPKDTAVPYIPPAVPIYNPYNPYEIKPPYKVTCAAPSISGGYNPKLGGGGAC